MKTCDGAAMLVVPLGEAAARYPVLWKIHRTDTIEDTRALARVVHEALRTAYAAAVAMRKRLESRYRASHLPRNCGKRTS